MGRHRLRRAFLATFAAALGTNCAASRAHGDPEIAAAVASQRREASSLGREILIESFNSPTHDWSTTNDPVMGGRSASTFVVEGGVGIFDGEVAIVTFLGAPGFVMTRTRGGLYPDVSSCESLKLSFRSGLSSYGGYRFSFGTDRPEGSMPYIYGYKARFELRPSPSDGGGGGGEEVLIPFDEFSDYWDPETGDPIVKCVDDARYCPTDDTLKDLKTMSIMGEGVAGKVHLEIESISAVGCAEEAAATAAAESGQLRPVEKSVEVPTFVSENGSPSNDAILIESFKGNGGPKLSWSVRNDPVMGGKSTGTFSTDTNTGAGILDGEVVDVPFLSAPGFIKAEARGQFPDVSSCGALAFTILTREPYDGYRVGFGTKQPPEAMMYIRGFHANLKVPSVGSFETVTIPFRDFSDKWDGKTGEQLVKCSDDPRYCPDEETLRDMKTLSIYAEGVNGEVHLEIRSIMATGCSSSSNVDALAAMRLGVILERSGYESYVGSAVIASGLCGFVFFLVSIAAKRRNFQRIPEDDFNSESLGAQSPEGL